ncbi:phage tail protein [Flavobacterium pallidum]|uniref:Phage tail protein n=1 Tax=Flavobacterium pallidum TaxID=2172098 RepID=A0A2S1SHF2_9FLAO|nr:tail fiber protein [Flavobacterium pallidum]AWI25772.1 phage tail protein [Flavobacterium pallidum]
MDQYLGQIILWAGNFAPKGWLFCNGQLLPINQNQALFSILGTTYGGDGVTNFQLPDLRGRIPVHANNGTAGPGLAPVTLGEVYGKETVTLTIANLAQHLHIPTPGSTVTVGMKAQSGDDADTTDPVGNYPHGTPQTSTYAASANAVMGTVNATVNVQTSGANEPMPILGPTLALNYCIALNGIYPSRN